MIPKKVEMIGTAVSWQIPAVISWKLSSTHYALFLCLIR